MNTSASSEKKWKPAHNWLVFFLIIILILWTAHAIAFFPHEYAHSFTAWVLGWKSNPLALNYGRLTPVNLLLQFQIDENVDYQPIFNSGHGYQAGSIALAGLLLGNLLLTYPLSLWGYYYAKQRDLRTQGLFCYWLCVASIGNLIDYVPVRTFGNSGDMHTLAKGFNISPWLITVSLGIPFMMILAHFLYKFSPRALHWLFPRSAGRRAIMIMLTSAALFGFYGAVGLLQDHPVSHGISLFSIYGLLPFSVIGGYWLTERRRSNR
jgi:hypothetical protein